MKLTLNDLEFHFKQIYHELEENGGELTEEIQDALAINKNEFEDRIENYQGMITFNEADIERLKLLKKNIDTKIKAKEKVNEYLKNIIRDAAKVIILPEKTKSGLLTYKADIRNIRLLVSPSQSVDIIDLELIKKAHLGKFNIEFSTNDEEVIKNIKESYPNIELEEVFVPDKVSIGSKLKNEEKVEGAQLQVNYNVNFK